MKKTILLQFGMYAILLIASKASAQNADELMYNQYLSQYNYVAGSFVIDTGISQANNQKRAFLIWADNLQPDTLKRFFSLSEYDGNLNFLTEQGNTTQKTGSVKNMFAKKIIKSKFESAYYLLAYVTSSSHTISGFKVNSSPMVFKIKAAGLGIVWAKTINLSAINTNNSGTVIEYNDIIETSDKNLVLVGKYATSAQVKEFVLATKLKGTNGALVWQYIYRTGANCNEAANSIAETTDKKLSLTGYVKKCTTSPNGNADVFYLQIQSTGVPVPGIYARFFWPSTLNMWADKITCYTASAGNDQLIISGYIDIQDVGAVNRQIMLLNIRQSGGLITAQHIGNRKTDVCNDLIFSKNGTSGNDYLVYLTGQTFTYPQDSTIGKAYFLYGKFNTAAGMTGISEFSTFPNSLNPIGNRTGVEIKNAGEYKKFAILATGLYKPSASTQTFSNVFLRDFNDTSDNCIKKQKAPLKQFTVGTQVFSISKDTVFLKVYNEQWIKLEKLETKEYCQRIDVDPNRALSIKQDDTKERQEIQMLRVSPNPAQSVISLTTIDGFKLAGNSNKASITIFNYNMQVQRVITVSPSSGNTISIPVANLTPGFYRVQLTRDNETLGCSFIKE